MHGIGIGMTCYCYNCCFAACNHNIFVKKKLMRKTMGAEALEKGNSTQRHKVTKTQR
ncbi:MAG: hypothetical protein H0W50_09910 [Parachlamydiaceae bacterium]|nr:hypothetical protein [Parachlamydiaceae bacterium]